MLSPIIALLVVLSVFASSVDAWSTGSGTCIANASAILAQTGRHPIAPTLGFYLDLPLHYQMGLEMQITINNVGKLSQVTGFSGFLIYAVDSQGNRQGTWTNIAGTTTTNMQNAVEAINGVCGNAPDSTITHASGGIKPIGMQLSWLAPSTSSVGVVTFMGLVEFSGGMYYTQVLTPWKVCPPDNLDECTKFDPSTLPSGPLPPSPPNTGAPPFGIQPVDQTACGKYAPLPDAAVPAGYCASLYAGSFLKRARGLYVTRYGDLLVLESGSSSISLLRDLNGDGVIDGKTDEYVTIFTQSGLNHGLYVRNGFIYTSTPTTVYQIPFNESDPTNSIGKARVIVRGIPSGGHTTRTVLVSHDNKWLLVSVGSAGNVDKDNLRSRVIRYSLTADFGPQGYIWNDYFRSDVIQPFAIGLRNAVGTCIDLFGEVWANMNADDNLNRPDLGGYAIHNDNPAERLDRLLESKMNSEYGYPYCWAADILPGYKRGDLFYWAGDGTNYNNTVDDDWCKQNIVPADYYLTAHTAPLGMAFYDGKGKYAFAPQYYNMLFVGMHGSWNSDSPRGYKVVQVSMDNNGNAIQETQQTFFGFIGPGERNDQWWRPVDVKVGVNGELFISSDNPSGVVVIRRIGTSHPVILKPQVGISGTDYSVIGGPTAPISDLPFDRPPANTSNPSFSWTEGSKQHRGLALFDGKKEYINLTAADNGAGAVIANQTGGAMSIELWFNPRTYSTSGSAVQVIFDSHAAQITDPSKSDYFAIGLTQMDQSSQSAVLVFFSEFQGQYSSAVAKRDVLSSCWHHVVVTIDKSGAMTMFFNGTAPTTGKYPMPPVLMYRQAGYLGRPHSQTTSTNIPLVYFAGAIDDFRMYSYALSSSQVQLNNQLSVNGKVSPLIFGHFSVKPMESEEPSFSFRGINNRIGDQPYVSNDLFTGYAHFDGTASYINLTNPANGIAVKLDNTLFQQVAQGMAIELWVRVTDMRTPSTILRLGSALSISYNSYSLMFAANTTSGLVSFSVPFLRNPGWTHVAWTISPGLSGAPATHTAYLNGTSVAESQSDYFQSFNVTNSFLGANFSGSSLTSRFTGDIAAFRVWNLALPSSNIHFLYFAQVDPYVSDNHEFESLYNEPGAYLEILHTSNAQESSGSSSSSNTVVLAVILSIVGSIVFAAVLYGLYIARQRMLKQYNHDSGILLA